MVPLPGLCLHRRSLPVSDLPRPPRT